MSWYSNKDTPKHLCDLRLMFNAFVSTCEVAFFTTHGQDKTCRCDTEKKIPVASLCGVVGVEEPPGLGGNIIIRVDSLLLHCVLFLLN